jgi:hypothetical protein
MAVAILGSQVQGDASVGGEAVEDGHRERGDACFGVLASCSSSRATVPTASYQF